MPWLRFSRDFDFHVRPGVSVSYRAGETHLVPARCADQAAEQGTAERVARPDLRAQPATPKEQTT